MHGWKGLAGSDADTEDKYRRAKALGTTECLCPTCGAPQQMTAFEFANGPFGLNKKLHLVCSVCNGRWTVDGSDRDRIRNGLQH